MLSLFPEVNESLGCCHWGQLWGSSRPEAWGWTPQPPSCGQRSSRILSRTGRKLDRFRRHQSMREKWTCLSRQPCQMPPVPCFWWESLTISHLIKRPILVQDPLLQKFVKIVTEHSNGQLGEKIWLETCRRIKVLNLGCWFVWNDNNTVTLFCRRFNWPSSTMLQRTRGRTLS